MRPRKAQGGGYGLDEMVRDATEAAKAWHRSHEAPTRSRGQARDANRDDRPPQRSWSQSR